MFPVTQARTVSFCIRSLVAFRSRMLLCFVACVVSSSSCAGKGPIDLDDVLRVTGTNKALPLPKVTSWIFPTEGGTATIPERFSGPSPATPEPGARSCFRHNVDP